LLERIIALVTDPGDLVLDPFCGSGTTLVAAALLDRKALGIDTSADAVSLTKARLTQPIRTSSEVLRRGRDAYVQSDEDALAYLHGLPVVPVQRNRGIDAIIKTPPGQSPVLVRVQRPGEPLLDAALQLHRAGATKQPATLVLLATAEQPAGGLFDVFPEDVTIINSTRKEILELLSGKALGMASASHNRDHRW
jgi:site-specific DNA-methyltransferase (adenine-specific)